VSVRFYELLCNITSSYKTAAGRPNFLGITDSQQTEVSGIWATRIHTARDVPEIQTRTGNYLDDVQRTSADYNDTLAYLVSGQKK